VQTTAGSGWGSRWDSPGKGGAAERIHVFPAMIYFGGTYPHSTHTHKIDPS